MLVLIGLGLVLPALALCYAKNFKPGLAFGYLVCLGLSAWVLWHDAWPAWPKTSVLLAALLILLPLVCFVIAVVDMRWGVFATQTFYLLAIPVLSCPLLGLLAVGWRLTSLVTRCG